jgi:CRP-like cAMP-binding protein
VLKEGHDGIQAESILQTLLESLRIHESILDGLMRELKSKFAQSSDAKDEIANSSRIAGEGNSILHSLSSPALAKLQPFLEGVKLKSQQRLEKSHRKIKDVHFLDSGLAAVMATTGVRRNETQIALIGKEGMTGLPIIFGSRSSPFDVVVEVEGHGQCISVDNLLGVMDESQDVHDAMMRHLHATWLQFGQTAAMNAHGTIEERLANLLVVAQDRLHTNELRMTHEQLATMLAVRRAGVTLALQTLEANGFITRHRGNITIVDLSGLEHRASRMV